MRTLEATGILDHEAPEIRRLAEGIGGSDRERVQAAHARIAAAVAPVYTLDERQPASRTLAKGRGSCSQRLALLEAVARAMGIETRVRAFEIDGRFWEPRFGAWVRPFLPRRVLLAWPQLKIGGQWVDVDELFGSASDLASRAAAGFTNERESLFEAIGQTAVDFRGKTCGTACDLSHHVRGDLGFFETRDELFATRRLLQDHAAGRIFEAIWGGRKSM